MIYFARYSGGQSYQKWGKDTVQQALNHIATEIHSQYELAYAPTTPIQPGSTKSRWKCGARERKSEPAPVGSTKVLTSARRRRKVKYALHLRLRRLN